MVVASPSPTHPEKVQFIELPIIDLSAERSKVINLVIKACEEYGFFEVINHGVSHDIITRMEEQGLGFFAKPLGDKQKAGPATSFGYGCKNIGFNGDVGAVDSAVNGYVEAVTGLACEILELMAEGLRVQDSSVFNPSFLANKVGFGEHTDPQILTILKSNDVGGLQVKSQVDDGDHGVWVPVPPHPTAFCVNVGDILQAMTNGRFMSVRHRAMVTNTSKSRMSMAYFGAPPLDTCLTPPIELVTPRKPLLYRPFTWDEYKKASHSLRLGDSRLHLFKAT
ncbi:hypothetical protein GOBAR_DD24238 [Gossypium barbadense]|nr:hypothetical protein GOBAR_DD24238 [Gossypium barbadense]